MINNHFLSLHMKTIWFPAVDNFFFIKSICNTNPKHSQRYGAGPCTKWDDMWIKKKRKQMVVTEDSENVWHSLLSQKKRRTVHRSHSLAAAVSANRAVEKKH